MSGGTLMLGLVLAAVLDASAEVALFGWATRTGRSVAVLSGG